MVYETFLNTIRVLIQEKLGDSCEVRPVKVLKNNGTVLDGLTILSGSFPAAPTIYLNDLYKLHLQGTGLHIIAETILRSIADSPVPPPDTIKQFTDYNLVRKKLAIRLLHAEKNKKLLSELPWFPVLDLALVFSIVVRTDTGDLYSCLITESHMNLWGITPGELKDEALANAPVILPPSLRTMAETIHIPEESVPRVPPLFVLTNSAGIQGASAILYPDVLQNVSATVNDDLVLIPSSIHEILLLPERFAGSREELDQMVKDVNRMSVEPVDQLSDHVYFFRREGGLITVPQGSCLATESTMKIPSAIAPAI